MPSEKNTVSYALSVLWRESPVLPDSSFWGEALLQFYYYWSIAIDIERSKSFQNINLVDFYRDEGEMPNVM
jgi:hypothetical protein